MKEIQTMKNIKKIFSKTKKFIGTSVIAGAYIATNLPVVAYAAGDTSSVTAPLDSLKTLVIAIIGALSCILIPTISGFVKEAKINAAITDARTVKQAIEFSLVNNLAITYEDTSGAFNKTLYLDQNRDRSQRQTETVGAFSQVIRLGESLHW